MATIFLSYRREDSGDATDRIYDRLVSRFGSDDVFMDVDAIRPGEDFKRTLEEQVGACQVMLVIIGRNWLGRALEREARRIDNSADFVRVEVELALRSDIAIIPVTVGGVNMPREAEFPESIRPLATRQAIPVRRNPDFERDMERVYIAVDTQKRAYVQRVQRRREDEERERQAREKRQLEHIPISDPAPISSGGSGEPIVQELSSLIGAATSSFLRAVSRTLLGTLFIAIIVGVVTAGLYELVAFLLIHRFPPDLPTNLATGAFALLCAALATTINLIKEAVRAITRVVELVVGESERLAEEATRTLENAERSI